jgi:hypothetical protein
VRVFAAPARGSFWQILLQNYFGGSQRAILIQDQTSIATLIQHSARPDSNVARKRPLAEFCNMG